MTGWGGVGDPARSPSLYMAHQDQRPRKTRWQKETFNTLGGGGSALQQGWAGAAFRGRQAGTGLQRSCVWAGLKEGDSQRWPGTMVAGTSAQRLSRTARNGVWGPTLWPSCPPQGWGLHHCLQNSQEAGWAGLSRKSHHTDPTLAGDAHFREWDRGGLAAPTYLPAVPTLVADHERGHGLVRTAGLHLWEVW